VPPGVFGTASLLVGLITFGTSIFCTPQLHAASRFYPELARRGEAGQLRATVGRTLRRTTAFLCGLVLVGGIFGSGWEGLSYTAFVLAAGLLAVEVFRALETCFLLAGRRQKVFALWGAAETWARPALSLLLVAVFGPRPECVLGGYLLATAAGYGLFALAEPRYGPAPATGAGDGALARSIRRYALPLVPLALVSWVNALADRYVIAGAVGVEAAGIYAAVYGLISRPFLMTHGVLLSVFRPAYFEAVSCGEALAARRTVRAWIGLTVGSAALGVGAVWALAGWLATLLLAERYRGGAALMPVLALGFALQIVSQVLNTVSLANKESKHVLYSEASGAASWFVIGIPAVLWLGVWGAALATALGYFIQMLVAARNACPRLAGVAVTCGAEGDSDV
jgi:O-antigen/teichoic acid export membrane protein